MYHISRGSQILDDWKEGVQNIGKALAIGVAGMSLIISQNNGKIMFFNAIQKAKFIDNLLSYVASIVLISCSRN